MLYCTVHALGELAVLFPVAGSFSTYSTRFLDPAWGFAMGWNYALQWMVTLPLEIVAACLTIQFWTNGDINNDAWVIIFLFVIAVINLFGVKGYGEAEFIFSIIKVIAVIGFIILGVIITVGGGPNGGYIGARYWYDPGAFNAGFKGLCSVFITAAFAFSGTELVGLGAAETNNPRKALPTAIKQVFWRITLFYIVSLTIVGCLVAYDNPALIGNSTVDANASPFVIAIRGAGIDVLPSIFNVVILIAVLSVGNSSVYGASRTLAALAAQGQAPKFLGFIDRSGRPMAGIIITVLFGFLAFLAGSSAEADAFNWMIAISGLSSIFTWLSICLCHIRFRHAWRRAGHRLDELAFVSQPGLIGSWLGLILNLLVLIAQFWTGFAPIGYGDMTAMERVVNWFQVYLAFPVVLAFYIPYKLYYKTKIVRTKDMDLQTGRRDLDLVELLAEERAERAQWSRTRKIYKFFC